MSVFGVILVLIFPHSDWIRRHGWVTKKLFLVALNTVHRRLKIDTIIKISAQDCLNFLKSAKKKLMKIFFCKCCKFVSTPFFCISKSFGYFYQKKIIHNIGVCVQNWQRVVSFLAHCWSKASFDSPLHWKWASGCD